MECSITKQDNKVVLGITGRLDSTNAMDLQEKIFAVLDEGSLEIVADLNGLDYISSAGLRVLLATAKRLSGKGHIHLCSVQTKVLEVFEMSGFTAIFKVFNDVDSALKG